jgi:hypothetical protein
LLLASPSLPNPFAFAVFTDATNIAVIS